MAMTTEQILERLRSLQRLRVFVSDPGCDCCSPYADNEPDSLGDWIRVTDVERLIEDIQHSI